MTSDPADASDGTGLEGIALEASRLEVRVARASIKGRLFARKQSFATLDRFEVRRRIGAGGMGVVYEAFDPKLQRKVALKILREDRKASLEPALLRREAQVMAKLSHPNVVPVFDAGTADDQVFVAMAYVPAPNLRQWLAGDPSSARIVEVLRQAGEGLAAAHEAGLVHCDFKPENVLVPDGGPAQVTDFGLARSVHASSTVDPISRSGTPSYMSPQRMRGEPVDQRDDQWAFCVTLFEALAGQRPFDDEGLAALAQRQPVRLPERPEAMPASVYKAVGRGLQPEAGARFPTMTALLETMAPRSASRRTPAIALVAGLVGVGGWWLGTRPDPCPRATDRLDGVWDTTTRQRLFDALQAASPALAEPTWVRVESVVDRHVASWLDSRQASCIASREGAISPERLDRRIACLDEVHDELRAYVEVLLSPDQEVVERAVASAVLIAAPAECQDINDVVVVDNAAAAELRAELTGVRALRRAGRAAHAEPRANAAVQRAEALGDASTAVAALLERGLVRAELAQFDGAVRDFQQVIERADGAQTASASAEAALSLIEIVGVGFARPEEGLANADMAELAIAVDGNAPRRRARLQLARGRVLDAAGRTTEALEHALRGLALLEAVDGDERVELDRAQARRVLAKIALSDRKPSQAERHAAAARATFAEVVGPRHPEVAQTLVLLGGASLGRGRVDEAVGRFTEAAEIHRAAYGERHPAYGRALANLGAALVDAQRPDEAHARYLEAVQILEAALGDADPQVAAMWINIGGLEHERGKPDAAVAASQRGLAALSIGLGPEHPRTLLALTNLGRLQLLNGDHDAAEASLAKALELRTRVLGEGHVDTARTRHAWGELLFRRGERVAAIAVWESVKTSYELAESPQAYLEEIERDLARGRAALSD